jgi:hypothetical protein
MINKKENINMAYSFKNSKGVTYFLHSKNNKTSTGKTTTLFFFSREIKEGAVEALPDGYIVSELKSTLPVLKKK